MKTVTIKLRIHKLLAEKRLTKYRFIAMTGLGYKNASRILDNETESIRFSTIARKKRAVNRRFAPAFVTALFGDPIFKNRSGTASEKTVPLNLSEYYI